MITHDRAPLFVYLDPPKTGTRSVVAWLLELFPASRKRGDHLRDLSKTHRRWAIFATVRNPYERAVSAWSKLIGENSAGQGHPGLLIDRFGDTSIESFLKWNVEDARLRALNGRLFPLANQTEFLELAAGLVGWERITAIKLESVPAGWTRLPFICRRMAARFPHRNASIDRVSVADQSAEFVELVNAWAAPDFERFGYDRIDPSTWRTRSGGKALNPEERRI